MRQKELDLNQLQAKITTTNQLLGTLKSAVEKLV